VNLSLEFGEATAAARQMPHQKGIAGAISEQGQGKSNKLGAGAVLIHEQQYRCG
jgi:hypothetical protein